MIKVIVNGYKGKMGQETVQAVKSDPELELAGRADIGDDLAGMISQAKADAVVDFTHPSVAMQNIRTITDNGACAVIGTTGFTDEDLAEIEKICEEKNVGVLIAPNFSIGAVLMMKFAAEAAKHLPNVEIIEYHHDNKADAPSGTAIKTAQLINESVGATQTPTVESKEQLETSSKGALVGNIRIHAVRLPGFVASQEVIFGGKGQTLSIRHDTINRECFMPGVVLACKKMANRKGLVYGIENLLEEN
ncbi:MAG: 4-hydroxy-tetrahydrodipicolinate reductase [Candidatus Cloacimonetes bacterium]|nr:4-hydroxy-tetrahydrodipicolinate reductase [Candidatus Cloacimonadota bacterium]